MAVKKCACPKIDPSQWEGKEFEWENKIFYFAPIYCFFHKRFNLEEKVRQLKKEIAEKGYAFTDFPPVMCEWESFKSRVLIEIKNPQQYDENIQTLDMGVVYSTVFEGPAKEFKRAVTEFASQIELNHGVPPQKTYVWYLHCKNCGKQRNNQAVIFVRT